MWKRKFYQTFIELTNGPITSKLLQKFVHSRISKLFIKPYARIFHINLQEIALPLSAYRNLHELFTRKLLPDARPIYPGEDVLVCPVDGVIQDVGIIDKELLIMVKDKPYSISEMLGSEKKANKYNGGQYVIIYLSPANYHRIHSPLTGFIQNQYSLGKESFPVNDLGLKYGKDPFTKNFRVITELKHNNFHIALVKVGAMFVNSIVITAEDKIWKKGEEVAYFAFGSTVILLMEKDFVSLADNIFPRREVKMGELLGFIKEKSVGTK